MNEYSSIAPEMVPFLCSGPFSMVGGWWGGGMGVHIVLPLSICISIFPYVMAVRPIYLYMQKMVSIQYLLKKISILDSYFILRYIIIKYRSASI